MTHNQLSEGQVERRLWSVLEANGQETLRETAKRLGLAPSSLHVFMRRQGYHAKAVTVWERDADVHPTLPIVSREMAESSGAADHPDSMPRIRPGHTAATTHVGYIEGCPYCAAAGAH